jgi:hypothetical protein
MGFLKISIWRQTMGSWLSAKHAFGKCQEETKGSILPTGENLVECGLGDI